MTKEERVETLRPLEVKAYLAIARWSGKMILAQPDQFRELLGLAGELWCRLGPEKPEERPLLSAESRLMTLQAAEARLYTELDQMAKKEGLEDQLPWYAEALEKLLELGGVLENQISFIQYAVQQAHAENSVPSAPEEAYLSPVTETAITPEPAETSAPATGPETGPAETATTTAPEPEAPEFTKDEVRIRMIGFARKGVDVQKVMSGMGYANLSAIPAKRYGELLKQAEAAAEG